MRTTLASLAAVAVLAGVPAARGDRRAVLPQIQVPHPYYFPEMYLPQLTSGPSAANFAPIFV